MVNLLLAVIYLAFISLGLPDSLLGAAWPGIYVQFNVPVSYSGAVSMLIALGTIISSLMSDRLNRRLGTGKVVLFSVLLTALTMLGFSLTTRYWQLIALAVPYGLGAGAIDAALNNYVALHYESRHMSWLHCFWGIGASLGPYIMGLAMAGKGGWKAGYLSVGAIQMVLTAILLFTMNLWVKSEESEEEKKEPVTMKEVFAIPGALEVLLMFACYSAVEQTAMLWSSSYLVLAKGLDISLAATLAAMFTTGLTVGRAVNGFLTIKFNDDQLIDLGCGVILLGSVLIALPAPRIVAMGGLVIAGFGCAPIYPCIIHSTPTNFGADKSQAIIGVQMAFAYIGTLALPPLFGIIAQYLGITLLPYYLLVFLVMMFLLHRAVMKKTGKH